MAIKKRLALYFSAEDLSLAEFDGIKLINHFHVPYNIFSKDEPVSSMPLTDEIRLTAVLQKTLRDNKIETKDSFMSLPSKDIILRSFFIPQMNKEEIFGAVEFEVRKYLPFKLDELVYDFQATMVKEGGAKKLRILFVGIRKDILAKYLYMLEQSGLKAITLEPAPISLLRMLIQRKFLSPNPTSAVIEVDHEEGNIIFLQKGLPQFIRDFKLPSTSAGLMDGQEDSTFIRLLNEVRVSLDYYRRQSSQPNFDKIIFCSERDIKEWAENLQKELNVPVIYLKPQDILSLKEHADIGLLNAFGAGLKDYVNLPVTINLFKKRVIQETKGIKQVRSKPVSLAAFARAVFLGAAFIWLVYVFCMRQVWNLNAQIKQISHTGSKFSGQKSEQLQVLLRETKNKIAGLKEIQSREFFTPKYASIARLLPEGAWLSNLELINTGGKSISSSIKGYVYSEKTENQINIVNKFLNNLRSDINFSRAFKNIDLNYVNQNYVGDFPITSFEINCR